MYLMHVIDVTSRVSSGLASHFQGFERVGSVALASTNDDPCSRRLNPEATPHNEPQRAERAPGMLV